MAYDTAFITIASVLATFDILPALDENGKEISVSDEMTSSTISYVYDYVVPLEQFSF